MCITIHRGARQIGGCVTEVFTELSRVFIDIGSDLLRHEVPPTPIDGLTFGNGRNSALFLTHYHADHIGRLNEVLPNVPTYMGKSAKGIQSIFAGRMQKDLLPLYNKIKVFQALNRIVVGDIIVTPLMIDHSAFDAYMFIIEAGGKRVLHTGDFRTHGPRGGKTFEMLKRYAKNIHVIICEGTTFSRSLEESMSEYELFQRAKKLMRSRSYTFVLCSSTNIDRIGAFYHANPSGRLFICDKYQKKILDFVTEGHAMKSGYYNFEGAYSYAPNLDILMEEKGFCMLIRNGKWFRQNLEKYFSASYREKSLLIYSMWPGYLNGYAKKQILCDFLRQYPKFETLHTSGHASPKAIAQLYDTVRPKYGLIPIHSETPEAFQTLIPNGNIIMLNDGEKFEL